MKKKHALGILLALALALLTTGAALAADEVPGDSSTGDTTGQTITGIIVGVDLEAGTIDVLQDGTIVTITVENGEYEHPIVALLAAYFGGAGIDDWSADLGAALTSVGVDSLVWDDVTAKWTITYSNGDPDETVDELPPEIVAALAALNVTLNVNGGEATDGGDGTLPDGTTPDGSGGDTGELTLVSVGDQIEAYHEDGMGFGVLVKLYAMAEESQNGENGEGVTVEELVEAFNSGTGMGELFAEHGKPSLLGVGHVRQAMGLAGNDGDNGNGHGNGHSDDGETSSSHGNDRNNNGNGPPEHSNAGGNGRGRDK